MPLFRVRPGFTERWFFLSLSFLAVIVASSWLVTAQQTRSSRVVGIAGDDGKRIELYDESHALVIGVSKYTNGWRELRGPNTDVIEIKRVLEAQGFKVTTMLNPTHAQLDQGMRDFINNYGYKERNRLLIYFAGHGHTERLPDGRDLGYIIPADAPKPDENPQLFDRRAISIDDLDTFARRIRSRHALFIFDSCFSGSLFEIRGENIIPAEIASRTVQPVRQFITSGTRGQTVPDESIFRQYFVRAFEQREGDLNGDGYVTGEELGKYLAGRVGRDKRSGQTPQYGKINDVRLNQGDFVFELPRKEPPVKPAVTTLPPVLGDQAMWDLIKTSDDPTDYEDYLKSYPTGIYVSVVRVKLRKLQALAAKRVKKPANLSSKSSSKTDPKVVSTKEPAKIEQVSFDQLIEGKIEAQTAGRRPPNIYYQDFTFTGTDADLFNIQFISAQAVLKVELLDANKISVPLKRDEQSGLYRLNTDGFILPADGEYRVRVSVALSPSLAAPIPFTLKLNHTGLTATGYQHRLQQIVKGFAPQKPDESIGQLERLSQDDPKQAGAYEYLGLLYNEFKKDQVKALAAMLQAIKLGGAAIFKVAHDSQWRSPDQDSQTQHLRFKELKTSWLRISANQLVIADFNVPDKALLTFPREQIKEVLRVLPSSIVVIKHDNKQFKPDTISVGFTSPSEAVVLVDFILEKWIEKK